jgi:hypothetical protein
VAVSREAVEVAIQALEDLMARAVRVQAADARRLESSSERVRQIELALADVRSVLDQRAPIVVMAYKRPRPSGINAGTPGLLEAASSPPHRTVRYLILDALRRNDREQGLSPLAIAAIIGSDKLHVHQQICHMVKLGTVLRLSQARYRIPENERKPHA